MISISTELNDELTSYLITPILLIELDFPSAGGGNLKITDAPRDITIGSDVYNSADNLKGASRPQNQSTVDRDQYTLQFVDVDNAMRTRFEAVPTGVPLIVRMVFMKDDGDLTSDVLDIYKGQSSLFNWVVSNGEPILTAGFTGQLAQLASAKVISTTPGSQADIDATDTCFQYVHETTNDSGLRWGRTT